MLDDLNALVRNSFCIVTGLWNQATSNARSEKLYGENNPNENWVLKEVLTPFSTSPSRCFYICPVYLRGAYVLWRWVLTLLWATTLRAKVAKYKEFMTKLSWLRDSSKKSSKPSYQSLLTSDHTIPVVERKKEKIKRQSSQAIVLTRYSTTSKTLLTGFSKWSLSKEKQRTMYIY